MNVLYIIMGLLLTVLFFINMKTASDILCRIIGGFSALFVYNTIASFVSLTLIGVNLASALVCAILGIPGGLLLICAAVLL